MKSVLYFMGLYTTYIECFLIIAVILFFIYKKVVKKEMKSILCFLGFHKKISVEKFDVYLYAKKALGFFRSTDYIINFTNHRNCTGDIHQRFVSDSVCIRCHKCFQEIDKVKAEIDGLKDFYIQEAKAKEIEKQMARDIFNEKCKK